MSLDVHKVRIFLGAIETVGHEELCPYPYKAVHEFQGYARIAEFQSGEAWSLLQVRSREIACDETMSLIFFHAWSVNDYLDPVALGSARSPMFVGNPVIIYSPPPQPGGMEGNTPIAEG